MWNRAIIGCTAASLLAPLAHAHGADPDRPLFPVQTCGNDIVLTGAAIVPIPRAPANAEQPPTDH